METALSNATTRDGRAFTVRRIVAPDPDWVERIIPFLGHKGQLWQWQMEQLLKFRFGGLTLRCYVADFAPTDSPPQIAAHLCTIENQDVGIFGHVFTLPAYRGQSLARVLTEACVSDFRARGGQALWLVTGYDTTPYRVYREHGFQSVCPEDGHMVWLAEGGQTKLAERFAAGQPTRVRLMDWPDYATLNALSCWPDGPPRRSAVMRVVGQTIVEQSFLELKRAMQKDLEVQARVLVTKSDWPVGWAVARPTAGEFAPYQTEHSPVVLDLFAHPNFEGEYPHLVAAIPLPGDRKILSIIDSLCPARKEALQQAGFVEEGRLTRVFEWQGRPADVVYMARNPGSAKAP